MIIWNTPRNEIDATNQWYALMKQRIAVEKRLKEAKAEEDKAEAWLTDYYPKYVKRKMQFILGEDCFLTLAPFPKVSMEDFEAFMVFVRAGKGKHDGLVYQRAKEETVREYFEKGEEVPGVVFKTIIKPSYRSL
jgi:hypothetical protein